MSLSTDTTNLHKVKMRKASTVSYNCDISKCNNTDVNYNEDLGLYLCEFHKDLRKEDIDFK